MEPNAQSIESQSRPYRSHKIPACNSCRKRKIRCEIDAASNSCRMCRERDTKCEFSRTMHQRSNHRLSGLRARDGRSHGEGMSETRLPRSSGTQHHTSPEECQSLIANPTMAEDLDILESYITSRSTTAFASMRTYIRSSRKRNESVTYLPVPERRPKLSSRKAPSGTEQRTIMDQVLGLQKEEVVKLYLTPFSILQDCGC